jgi:hypothetical protein
MRRVKDARHYFHRHKDSAKQRGIRFLFTFAEWEAWWIENLGADWLKKRGPRSGQYVMARKGDKGPYAPWNVECITSNKNHSDTAKNGTSTRGIKNPNAKFSEANIREIYLSLPKHEDRITAKYNISRTYIYKIKQRKIWAHVTEGLRPPVYRGYARGANHGNAKLTVELVREIYFSKEPTTMIAKRLGVPKGNIKGIRNRREWKSTTEGWGPAPARSQGRGVRMDLLYKQGLL